MTAPRGSGEYWNDVLSNVLKRAKVLADHVASMGAQSGYPPLTEPLTLARLKKVPPAVAAALLRDELARTTQLDPVTHEPIVAPKTLDLITSYFQSLNEGALHGING